MELDLRTPGVYINEINAFPSSAVAVATAVPVFIGYTEKAERNGRSLVGKPVRISSFAEYLELFGGAFKPVFTISPAIASAAAVTADAAAGGKGKAKPSPAGEADAVTVTEQVPAPAEPFVIGGIPYSLLPNTNNTAYFYNSIRLFYANGGSNCYILPVGTYTDRPGDTTGGIVAREVVVKLGDYIDEANGVNVFKLLETEFEPTLIVIPDIIGNPEDAYTLYQQVLIHCKKMQSRFGIFDVAYQGPNEETADVIGRFRDKIGNNFLNYGAAYYPWLRTSVVQASELDHRNLDPSFPLENLLPEPKAKDAIANFRRNHPDPNSLQGSDHLNFHQSLLASSPTYVNVLSEVRRRINLLPPSAAMAGIYTLVDSTRGVWKAPANVSLSMVDEPLQNISHDQQLDLNVDAMTGKSINVIRPFPGIGTMVWGARTLDGNSQDWRYVNVRRTLIMIEQSLKLAARTYVFEPNDASTWLTISAMMGNFLFNLWKSGALAGAAPEQAYNVQIGLGSTMTPTDILDGIMRINVKVAIVRPAEFIVITFQQQQQQS